MQDLPDGVRAGLVPSKTYEYMASGTRILAAVPDGDARDVLLAVGTATVCRPADVECLTNALRERVREWQGGGRELDPDPQVLAQFEYRRLAERMAALIRDIADRSTRSG